MLFIISICVVDLLFGVLGFYNNNNNIYIYIYIYEQTDRQTDGQAHTQENNTIQYNTKTWNINKQISK